MIGLAAVSVVLASCADPGIVIETPIPDLSPTSPTAGSSTASASPVALYKPCIDGKLRIGDLPLVDREWQAGLTTATELATAWQPDATLFSIRVSCQLLESGFRWQITFYSVRSQLFFDADTGETRVTDVDPAKVPVLDPSGISFGLLRRSLAKAGYNDDVTFNPSSGVEVRKNAPGAPFGPSTVPQDISVFHVALIQQGEIKDLFVDAKTGTTYRH